ncbi:1-acyl-sn-glycerol-3-phosphate acyltransferase [Duganella sp. BJB488]|uniref:lysophospholipid acyltransferase family protein n=1 Tax=unclassified Duganella TaxID=2636909 RepID=UPI000E344001|nr:MULTISPECIES: lysophospholipid acyltransferase family protein [unclassified Duganella]RFP26297.1 1-acyl-sn-glycerol-3-phosphate acyltransferase [Duganella sp. BJB489]RFP27960.1 1-acyl-sn-glycerol-3-phosphate acyltransferase [Duganella sp. BJB488]RFP37229.1 1-acyl-sn-glycerol-3-phosphate acyltransferase [Duganella sp. BJB480]
MKLSMIFRLARVFLHVLRGMAICATVFPWIGQDKRNGHIRRWSTRLLAMCNVTVEQSAGVPLLERAMVVANHVSWLDIFVIHSLHPSHFVAKAEIRSWPLAGWLAEKAGTVFIARGNRRDLRHIFKGLVHTLERGERVAFFPEGTTAAQGSLLPFHANLFEAAIDAKVPVQAIALSYRDPAGASHPSVDFIGETTFAESIMLILDGPPVTARLTILPAIDSIGTHRRELAEASHQAVAAALGVTAGPH